MISKTIGFRGTNLFSDTPKWLQGTFYSNTNGIAFGFSHLWGFQKERTGRSWRSPRPMGALGRKNVGGWMFQFFSWLSPFFWMLDSWIQIRYWVNIPQNKCSPVFGRRIGIIPSGQCGSFGDLSLWSHYEYPHIFSIGNYESKPLVNPVPKVVSKWMFIHLQNKWIASGELT